MTATDWWARDQYAVGRVTGSLALGSGTINWGSSTGLAADDRFPWPTVRYPTLLVLGLGFTLSTGLLVANRRPRVEVTYPGGGSFVLVAANTIPAVQSRRLEMAPGMHPDSAPSGLNHYRIPLPEGLMLLGGEELVTTLEVSITNFQDGDTLSDLVVRGALRP